MLELKNDPAEREVVVCGQTIVPNRIKTPALRKMVTDLARGDETTMVACRHKDWSQQAQCGCVMGCLGG